MKENPVERMYEALDRGDVDAMRGCFTPDAVIWHSFDGKAQNLDEAAKGWAGLIGHSTERRLADISRLPTTDGFVQQHVFIMGTQAGTRLAWPVCLVVKTRQGLIARIDEYMDRAGSFSPEDGELKTPGF